MLDPNEQDAYKNNPEDGDDRPAALTSLQAQKCASIIGAFADGQIGWEPHVRTVVRFLNAAAIEGSAGEQIVRPGTTELWSTIRDLPWPASGGPKAQPDI
jgi:hypothetical protein